MSTASHARIPQVKPALSCRSCKGLLTPLIDLGNLYVSDFPKEVDLQLPRAPHKLMRCNGCLLVQLSHTYPREALYTEYWYRSGINPAMREHLKGIVEKAKDLVELQPRDLVVDVGANDGTLLSFYPKSVGRVAYEPAKNLRDLVLKQCNILEPGFFPPEGEKAWRALPGSVKVLTSIAMFYDLEDPGAFVKEVKRVLHPEGVWAVEMHYLPEMLDSNGIDAVCAEHLTYFCFTTLSAILEKHQLQVIDIDFSGTNGGSACYWVTHRNPQVAVEAGAVKRIRATSILEHQLRLDSNDPYFEFQERVEQAKTVLRKMVLSCVVGGKVIDLYGASTKGNSLLQYWGLDSRHIRQALERDERKWGRLTVGTWIPIVAEDVGRGKAKMLGHPGGIPEPASVWLCPIWHFKEAVLEREKDFLEAGGEIVFPLPWPTMVSREGERRLS